MSIHSCRATRSFRDVDLPILPFLAPRVFGLWPKKPNPVGRRVPYTSRTRPLPQRSSAKLRPEQVIEPRIPNTTHHVPRARSSNSTSLQCPARNQSGLPIAACSEEDARGNTTVDSTASSGSDALHRRNPKSHVTAPKREARRGFRTALNFDTLSVLDIEESFDEIQADFEEIKNLPNVETLVEGRARQKFVSEQRASSSVGDPQGAPWMPLDAADIHLGEDGFSNAVLPGYNRFRMSAEPLPIRKRAEENVDTPPIRKVRFEENVDKPYYFLRLQLSGEPDAKAFQSSQHSAEVDRETKRESDLHLPLSSVTFAKGSLVFQRQANAEFYDKPEVDPVRHSASSNPPTDCPSASPQLLDPKMAFPPQRTYPLYGPWGPRRWRIRDRKENFGVRRLSSLARQSSDYPTMECPETDNEASIPSDTEEVNLPNQATPRSIRATPFSTDVPSAPCPQNKVSSDHKPPNPFVIADDLPHNRIRRVKSKPRSTSVTPSSTEFPPNPSPPRIGRISTTMSSNNNISNSSAIVDNQSSYRIRRLDSTVDERPDSSKILWSYSNIVKSYARILRSYSEILVSRQRRAELTAPFDLRDLAVPIRRWITGSIAEYKNPISNHRGDQNNVLSGISESCAPIKKISSERREGREPKTIRVQHHSGHRVSQHETQQFPMEEVLQTVRRAPAEPQYPELEDEGLQRQREAVKRNSIRRRRKKALLWLQRKLREPRPQSHIPRLEFIRRPLIWKISGVTISREFAGRGNKEFTSREIEMMGFKKKVFSWGAGYRRLYLGRLRDSFHKTKIDLHPDVINWVSELTRDGIVASSIERQWRCLLEDERIQRWPQMVLWSLAHAPQTIPLLLEATHRPRFLGMMSDCLLYLEKFHLIDELPKRRTAIGHTFAFFFFNLIRASRSDLIRPRLLNILAKYCTDDEAPEMFDGIIGLDRKIAPNTILYMMGRFTDTAKFDYALKALEYLATRGVDLSSGRVLSRCTSLLKKSESQMSADSARRSHVLRTMLKAGIEPNRILNNVILSNTFKAEGSEVGWKVFNHLLAHGHKPDEVTYLALLEDAISNSDEELLQRHLVSISTDQKLVKSDMLVGYSMHAIRQINKNRNPYGKDDLRPTLFPIYARLHNIQPLKDLRIIPDDWVAPRGAISTTSPHPPALAHMITAFSHAQTDPDAIVRLYSRFRKLVIDRHPAVFRLTLTDYTYNAFLMALYRHVAYLPQCIRILEDMLAPLPPRPIPPESSQKKGADYYIAAASHASNGPSAPPPSPTEPEVTTAVSTSHCKPTVITWNILLLAFFYHNQPSSVEKVRAMMFKRGIRFSQRCWDLWVRGHAGMNMSDKVVAALEEMETEGFVFGFDSWRVQKGSKGMDVLGRNLQHWQKVKMERMRLLGWREGVRDDQTSLGADEQEAGDRDQETVKELAGADDGVGDPSVRWTPLRPSEQEDKTSGLEEEVGDGPPQPHGSGVIGGMGLKKISGGSKVVRQ